MKSVYRDEQYEIFEFTKAFPRAFLASSFLVENDDQKILDDLFSKDFPLRDTLVLEKKPTIVPQQGDGTASIVSYTANNVTIQTSSSVAKLLFLSDTYDSGWHVRVDGMETSLYRADYDFRAVAVPAGSHMVQFTYTPRGLQEGMIFVYIAIVGIGILFIGIKKYEHRHL